MNALYLLLILRNALSSFARPAAAASFLRRVSLKSKNLRYEYERYLANGKRSRYIREISLRELITNYHFSMGSSDKTTELISDIGSNYIRSSGASVLLCLVCSRMNTLLVVQRLHTCFRDERMTFSRLYGELVTIAEENSNQQLHSKAFGKFHKLVNYNAVSFVHASATYAAQFRKTPLGKQDRLANMIEMARQFGSLTAKNCYLYLYHVSVHSRGPGTPWGPGSHIGENVLSNRVLNSGKDHTSMGCKVQAILDSRGKCLRLRRSIGAVELPEGLSKADVARLEESRETLMIDNDAQTSHLYCELGKTGQIISKSHGKGKIYYRRNHEQYISDSDYETDENSDVAMADSDDESESDDDESDYGSDDEALEFDGIPYEGGDSDDEEDD